MNKLLSDNRFVAIMAYATLVYVLAEYAREQYNKRSEWIARYKASPHALFMRSQRERIVASEFATKEDCGCGDA